MAIDASKVYRTTVDLNQAVLQFNSSKPDWLIDDLQSLPLGGQCDTQMVQSRVLSRPFQWVRKFPYAANVFRFLWDKTMYLRLTGSFAICISQFQKTFRRRGELNVELYLQESILVLFIQLGLNEKILNVTLDWDGKEDNVPKDSFEGEPDSPRNMLGFTDRTATNENTEVSMAFSRH